MSLKPRHRRWQLSLAGSLGIVALLAVLLAWLRPISPAEAIRVAELELRRQSATAGIRVTAYRPHFREADGGDGRIYRIVNFVDPADGETRAQVSMDWRGNVKSVVLAPP